MKRLLLACVLLSSFGCETVTCEYSFEEETDTGEKEKFFFVNDTWHMVDDEDIELCKNEMGDRFFYLYDTCRIIERENCDETVTVYLCGNTNDPTRPKGGI